MTDFETIRASEAFARLTANQASVDIWPDKEFSEGDFSYYWAMANDEGAVRMLGYFRCKGTMCEHRAYDANGDDLWLPAS